VTNIFVSSDDVKVIGGVSNVNVEVDFGPQGDRGNLFLVGLGNPNTISHSVTLQLLDIYINVQATDEDYLVIYQYQNVSGVNTWVETSKLTTDKFSVNRTVGFVDGVSTNPIDFKVSNIIPISLIGGLTAADFNVQCTISHPDSPVASSITVLPITIQSGTGDIILPVTVNAAKFSDSEWSSLSGTFTIHFLITLALKITVV
jgi:hypothetical protein